MPFQQQSGNVPGWQQQHGGGSSRGRGGGGFNSRRARNKCAASLQGNVRFCVHCLTCGEEGHRTNTCPQKTNASNNGGNNNSGGNSGSVNAGPNIAGGNRNAGGNPNVAMNMNGFNLPQLNVVDGIIYDNFGNPVGIDQGNG